MCDIIKSDLSFPPFLKFFLPEIPISKTRRSLQVKSAEPAMVGKAQDIQTNCHQQPCNVHNTMPPLQAWRCIGVTAPNREDLPKNTGTIDWRQTPPSNHWRPPIMQTVGSRGGLKAKSSWLWGKNCKVFAKFYFQKKNPTPNWAHNSANVEFCPVTYAIILRRIQAAPYTQ